MHEPKLVALPGVKLAPKVLLHRTLEKIGHIKAVTVVIQWDDDTFACDWSTMKVSELCMAEKILSIKVTSEVQNPEKY